MVLVFPCEKVKWTILPAVRKELSLYLINVKNLERKKVCESIRNAMNFYLNESNPTPIARAARAASKPQNQMSEEDWNKVPTIQKPEPIIKNETTESVGYQKTDTNMTMNADNSVNLSHLTTEDMSDFRTLAGIT